MTSTIRTTSAVRGRVAALALSAAAVLAAAPAHAQLTTRPAAEPSRVWEYAEVTGKPQLVNERAVARFVSRSYPTQQLDFGVSGRALLELTVGLDGQVEQVAGVDATLASFGAVARRFAHAMRFAPATVEGVPVRCRVTVPVDFAMGDG